MDKTIKNALGDFLFYRYEIEIEAKKLDVLLIDLEYEYLEEFIISKENIVLGVALDETIIEISFLDIQNYLNYYTEKGEDIEKINFIYNLSEKKVISPKLIKDLLFLFQNTTNIFESEFDLGTGIQRVIVLEISIHSINDMILKGASINEKDLILPINRLIELYQDFEIRKAENDNLDFLIAIDPESKKSIGYVIRNNDDNTTDLYKM